MIVFKDVYSGDEMFTDSNKFEKTNSDEVIRVSCQMVREEEKNDFDIGANASQEEACEELQTTVKEGIDLAVKYKLQEVTGDYSAKTYGAYLKSYIKKLILKMKEDNCSKEEAACLHHAWKAVADEIKEKFDDIQFFRAEIDYEKCEKEEDWPFVIPLHRCPQTGKLTMWFFKRGLEEEKF